MRWLRKRRWEIKDESVELYELLDDLKGVWNNYEQYLNSLEDAEMMEIWTYKVLIQKQLYRYVYGLVKDYYEGGDKVAKHVCDPSGNTNRNHSV